MKKYITPFCFVLGGLLMVIAGNAQGGFNYKKKSAPATTTTKDSVVPAAPVAAPAVTAAPVVADPNVKPNKSIDTTLVGGFNSNARKSLRNNYGFSSSNNGKKSIQQRTPANYQNLREEDALFSEFVWEEVDGREKINRPFIYQAYDDNGDQRFFAILLKAANSCCQANDFGSQ